MRVSLPAPPIRVSLPSPPSRVLLAAFPVKELLAVLPVPLIALEPVKVRFSMLGKVAREKVTED
jgi:hypothetical protein